MVLVLKALDGDGAERRIEPGASFTMGRGADNDLVLVDPAREVSKTHCRIEGDGGKGFVLIDLSINGVFIEGQGEAMRPGSRHRLASGDQFKVGPHRFAVAIAEPGASAPVLPDAAAVPANVSNILDGTSEGPEQRAAASGSGEAERWLGTLPKGSADETLHEPMGWDAPPSIGGTALPSDFGQPAASDFANRSEHVPAAQNALHVPRMAAASQLLPMDWLDDEPSAPASAAAPSTVVPTGRGSPSLSGAPPPPRPSADLRRPFAETGRIDPAAIASVTDEQLMRRCGEALRAVLDGLDTAEAAQAVAERDCGLPTPVDTGLWGDFFTNNRDPLVSLLVEAQPGPARALGQRFAALADRQRALGRGVAEAAETLDARISPEPIAAESRHRFAVGPLADAAAWKRFVGLHGELAAMRDREAPTNFLVLLRKSFARAMIKRA